MPLKIKLKKFTAASGAPTTSDLEDGEVGINPVQQKVFVNNGGSIVELAGQNDLDLSAVAQDILPDGNGPPLPRITSTASYWDAPARSGDRCSRTPPLWRAATPQGLKELALGPVGPSTGPPGYWSPWYRARINPAGSLFQSHVHCTRAFTQSFRAHSSPLVHPRTTRAPR